MRLQCSRPIFQEWRIEQQMLFPEYFNFLLPGFPGRPSSSGGSPRSTTTTDSAMPRLDISSLVPVVQELSAAGVAPSTRKVYGSDGRRYRAFCDQGSLQAYPVSEHGLMLFTAHLFTEKLSHGTIKSYLAAVCYDILYYIIRVSFRGRGRGGAFAPHGFGLPPLGILF